MSSILDDIIENQTSGARVVSEQHDESSINWVAGLSDPGEMIRCGYLPQIRRQAGEQDREYADRIRPIVMALPKEQRDKIMGAAIRRAGLDTSNGRVNMMAVGTLPWHGLGVLVDKAATSAEAIQFAGLNWRVEKTQLYYQDATGTWREATDSFGIVRQDTGAMLGTVGRVYKPLQNDEGFSYLDGVLEQYGAKYESAGAIYGGKQVWMLAYLPEQSFVVNGGDEIEPYVIFTNSHDGSGAAACYPTSVRVVCANTYRVSMRDSQKKGIRIRHTGDISSKIEAGKEALGFAVESFGEFKEAAEHMYKTPCDIKHYASDVLDAVLDITQADIEKGVDLLAASIATTEANLELARNTIEAKIKRRGEILDDILERYESERCGVGSMRGTTWACFNAVTEHADHAKIGRQSRNNDIRMSRRFESVIAGEADAMKQTAFELAMR